MARARVPPSPPPPAPLMPTPTAEFKKDARRQKKRGKDMTRLGAILEARCSRTPLSPRQGDHALAGDPQGWRDCHVEPDWLLIYRVDEEAGELILGRTGSHADLFE